jgi:hypothetical protein
VRPVETPGAGGVAAFVAAFLLGAGLFVAASVVKGKRGSSTASAPPLIASTPVPAPTPAPYVPPAPRARPSVRVVRLPPVKVEAAERELTTLLGTLYYPGATVPSETVLADGRTFREGDGRTSPLYPSVALEPPDAYSPATLEVVTAYYERLLPQGHRLPEGGFRADNVPRPGDGVPVRVFVFRARRPEGRVTVMFMTFK